LFVELQEPAQQDPVPLSARRTDQAVCFEERDGQDEFAPWEDFDILNGVDELDHEQVVVEDSHLQLMDGIYLARCASQQNDTS